MKDFQFITNSHSSFIEELYKDFLNNPNEVDPEYKKFFEGFDFANSQLANLPKAETEKVNSLVAESSNYQITKSSNLDKEFAVYQLIRAYRKRGHLVSNTNPIKKRKDRHANLELSHFGLTDADLETEFSAGNFCGIQLTKLKDIVGFLKSVYTSTVGIEFTYINNEEICNWVREEFEKTMLNDIALEKGNIFLFFQKISESLV